MNKVYLNESTAKILNAVIETTAVFSNGVQYASVNRSDKEDGAIYILMTADNEGQNFVGTASSFEANADRALARKWHMKLVKETEFHNRDKVAVFSLVWDN